MKQLWLIPMFVLGVARADEGTMIDFKGYAEINQILKERVAKACPFELGQYVGESGAEATEGGLTELLGHYRRDHDLSPTFINGHPNSLTLVLWSVLLSRFADDVSAFCRPGAPPPDSKLLLNDSFRSVLTPLCQWPSGMSQSPVALRAFWDALMGFDAPTDERAAWESFARAEASVSRPAEKQIARLIVAALLNPYFLLRD